MGTALEPAHRVAGPDIIYVLDDEPDVCALLTALLDEAGFAARGFTRVAEMEMALTLHAPAVIIVDLTLGESDAIEVIHGLANRRYGGAVMLTSGRHDARTVAQVEHIGRQNGLAMLPFLRKPFQIEDLQQLLAGFASLRPPAPGGTRLEDALRNNWLELWYQPKIDLASRRVYGAEALVRLRHPERGIVAPSSFLPAPGHPLHRPLADFVIRRALADWHYLEEHRIAIKIAVNVPVSVFEDSGFVGGVRKYLPKQPGFPGMILELTEEEVIRDPDFAREVAIQLKLYGVDVAIDDFGCRFSTLERLQQLPFTELKIDQKFVRDCDTEPRKYELCRSIVALAHRFQMTAVAEGIESAGEAQALTRLGCDGGQGFFFARPQERDAFVRMLLERAIAPARRASAAGAPAAAQRA